VSISGYQVLNLYLHQAILEAFIPVFFIMGLISSLTGIGGGSLVVPFLNTLGVGIHKAIGTSSALGFVIAIAAVCVMSVFSQDMFVDQSFITRQFYWPAILLIAPLAFITAPLGAIVASRLEKATLEKLFAVLLIVLGVRMFLSSV